jgi:hypothetical protein
MREKKGTREEHRELAGCYCCLDKQNDIVSGLKMNIAEQKGVMMAEQGEIASGLKFLNKGPNELCDSKSAFIQELGDVVIEVREIFANLDASKAADFYASRSFKNDRHRRVCWAPQVEAKKFLCFAPCFIDRLLT